MALPYTIIIFECRVRILFKCSAKSLKSEEKSIYLFFSFLSLRLFDFMKKWQCKMLQRCICRIRPFLRVAVVRLHQNSASEKRKEGQKISIICFLSLFTIFEFSHILLLSGFSFCIFQIRSCVDFWLVNIIYLWNFMYFIPYENA